MVDPAEDDGSVRFRGDAVVMLTAPFFPEVDALEERPPCRLPADGVLDTGGRLTASPPRSEPWFKGSLTFEPADDDAVTHFVGSEELRRELAAVIDPAGTLEPSIQVRGLLFPDGYGSIAVQATVAGGWEETGRDDLLERFGPPGRETTAAVIRDVLLDPLTQLSRRCGAGGAGTAVPYFNQTYAASTSHPAPGRAALADELRALVYPRSAAPLVSDSPWFDEFLYAGYAYTALASAQPAATLGQLEQLLLRLDVVYARLARSAAAADVAIRGEGNDNDIDWLVSLERRLRADYHALATPTFSFDYHVLKLRDAFLSAWDTDALRARTESLLSMARQSVERRLAEQQAKRVRLLNYAVFALTALSIIATFDAAFNLWDKMTG